MTKALTLNGLSVAFGGFKAIKDVSLAVGSGELRVLLGANGAGKTTLMDLVSGKIRSTGGSVRLLDQDITNWPEHRIARVGLGRKFQIPSVFRDLSVQQNIEVACCNRHPSVFANLRFGLPADRRRRIAEILELTGLADAGRKTAAFLSHGQTQWLELGMLMAQDPKVILLDEPTAGMTHAETAKTADIINRLKGRHTLLVVEHDMGFVREIAEHITVLHLGEVLAEGSVSEIENDARVRAAYLGSKGIS